MKINSIYHSYFNLINGLFFGIILLILTAFNPLVAFRYDCRLYWELTHAIDSDGVFNLLNFKEALRGVLFSIFLYPALKISQLFHWNEILTCRVYLILIYSTIFSFLLPKAYKAFIGKELQAIRHAILGALLLLFWWEYFTLPLTDMLGMILLFAAFFLLIKGKWFYFLLSGICLYAAINMRLVYILSIPFYFVYFLLTIEGISNKIKSLGFAFIGFVIAVAPQWYVNHFNFNSNTWFVPTQASQATGGKSLLLMQLNWGLSIQKYETNIDTIYPTPEVKYLDASGLKLSEIHGNKDFISTSEYFYFVLHHPILFKIYLKHLFNGFDITTPKAYLTGDIYHRNLLLKIFNYTLLFTGIAMLIIKWKFFERGNLLIGCMVAFIIAAIVPTALEVRFFLPAQILIYFLATSISKADFTLIKKRVLILFVLYICFIGAAYYLNMDTARQIEYIQ